MSRKIHVTSAALFAVGFVVSGCADGPKELSLNHTSSQLPDTQTNDDGTITQGLHSAGAGSYVYLSGPQRVNPEEMLIFALVVTRDGSKYGFTLNPEQHVVMTFEDSDGTEHTLSPYTKEQYEAKVTEVNSAGASVSKGIAFVGGLSSLAGAYFGMDGSSLMMESVNNYTKAENDEMTAENIGRASSSSYFDSTTFPQEGDTASGLLSFGAPEENDVAGPFIITVTAGPDEHDFNGTIRPVQN